MSLDYRAVCQVSSLHGPWYQQGLSTGRLSWQGKVRLPGPGPPPNVSAMLTLASGRSPGLVIFVAGSFQAAFALGPERFGRDGPCGLAAVVDEVPAGGSAGLGFTRDVGVAWSGWQVEGAEGVPPHARSPCLPRGTADRKSDAPLDTKNKEESICVPSRPFGAKAVTSTDLEIMAASARCCSAAVASLLLLPCGGAEVVDRPVDLHAGEHGQGWIG